MRKLVFVSVVLALAALLLSVYVIVNINNLMRAATSELSFQEKLVLNTPVLDEQSGQYGIIAIYEFRITNDAGPLVKLLSVEGSEQTSGFVVALKGDKVLGQDFGAKLFAVPYTAQEIQEEPAKLRECMKNGGDKIIFDEAIKPGATHNIRMGVSLYPYDNERKAKTNLVLISLMFKFDNLKNYTRRQGFPIVTFE